jgi:alanine racemase
VSLQWIEIDADALGSNIRVFRDLVGPDVLLAPVVKSNGYGHGLEIAARAFAEAGADWLCVHSPDEADRVYQLGLNAEILQLGPVEPECVASALRTGVHLTLSEPARLQMVLEVATAESRTARIHLKVETGTWRQGADATRLAQLLKAMAGHPHAELVGIHSHFANIEDTTRHDFAASQIQQYGELLRQAQEAGCPPRLRHFASSAAALLFPHTHLDLVRPGIASYGYWPSRETLVSARATGSDAVRLTPALTWKSVLTEIKPVAAGNFVGYGCTEKIEIDTRLAIIPVGYADGYRRAMGGRAHVLVRGRRCPVRGRICMNLIMVDVGHLEEVEVGDEAVLLGAQGGEVISPELLAEWSQSLHYEVLAGLNPEIERRLIWG